MAYNPDAMTIIVSGDMPPEMKNELVNQLTADVLTSTEFAEREAALAKQEEVEAETRENRQEAGLEEGDGFSAPSETDVDDVDVTDTSDPENGEDDGLDDLGKSDETDNTDASDDVGDTSADDETKDDEEQPADSSEEVTEEAEIDEADLEEVTEEDAAVEDELDEPNAAFEHAQSIGSKEVGRFLRLGSARYKRRIRRLKAEKDLNLAQETLQMDAAQRQKLVRRLLYVKPAESGFNSKLQTFISTISNPNDWIALIDDADTISADQELSKKQITEALSKAGIEMFENVETLANTYNQVQKAITEPSGTQQEDEF